VVLIILPLLIPKWFIISEWESGPPTILSFLFLTLSATAFAFYIRYVAEVFLTLYIMFKVLLVCLLPLLILIILYRNKSLRRIIGILQDQNKYYFSKIGEYEKIEGEEEIDIHSDNKSDKLRLKYKNIVSIKSADNYIEIYYLDNGLPEKKLLRSTLRNIELQLTDQRNFIRCHRTSLVNVMFIEKLVRNYSGHNLKMSCLEETIPVSRQYLIQVKEAISAQE
ncbi:LytR/AlgR family response regulator transcription factor, partial [Bacteroidota bacterium]